MITKTDKEQHKRTLELDKKLTVQWAKDPDIKLIANRLRSAMRQSGLQYNAKKKLEREPEEEPRLQT